MSLRSILPQIIQPFVRHADQPQEPICLSPQDVIQLMDFVERNARRRRADSAPGALGEDAPLLVPEEGFRY